MSAVGGVIHYCQITILEHFSREYKILQIFLNVHIWKSISIPEYVFALLTYTLDFNWIKHIHVQRNLNNY